MSADKDYFEDLLKDFDDPKEETQISEEEQRRKNKDAEEARKRREAEAKAKAEAEAQADGVEEKVNEPVAEKAEAEPVETKVDEPVKQAEAEVQKKANQTNLLGEQLVRFKAKYPEIDLAALDKDANFKKFINGKLLGKQDFIGLYDDYIELKSNLSGTKKEELQKNYALKAKASSGTSKPAGKADAAPEVYTQEELNQLLRRIPLMSDRDVKKIQEKFDRSVEYYKKNK